MRPRLVRDAECPRTAAISNGQWEAHSMTFMTGSTDPNDAQEYARLEIKRVDEDATGVPPASAPSPQPYDIVFELSREATRNEAAAISGALDDLRDSDGVRIRVNGDRLIVSGTTIEHVGRSLRRRLSEAVDVGNGAGQRDYLAATAEADRITQHRRHVADIARALGW